MRSILIVSGDIGLLLLHKRELGMVFFVQNKFETMGTGGFTSNTTKQMNKRKKKL